MENLVRNFRDRSSKLITDPGGKVSNHIMAALVRVVRNALQRVASEVPARYILLLKLLRWYLRSVVPGVLKLLGTLTCKIFSENGSFCPRGLFFRSV
ncbi:uncharacterized protein DS421_11g334350 [Arachis hypogaea]|nr:uncharacterized protein DS421_11g334350 [Arachis hypogaea]